VISPSVDRRVERFFVVCKILISNSKIVNPNTVAIVTEKRDAGVNGEPMLVSKKIIEFIGRVNIIIGLVKLPYSLVEFKIAILNTKSVQKVVQVNKKKFSRLRLPRCIS
jgi:rRNA processing protein Gar1